MKERDKIVVLWLLLVAFMAFLVASSARGQDLTNLWHDPALDGINNNLTVMDANLSGNFDNQNKLLTNDVPNWMAHRFFTKGTNDAEVYGSAARELSGLNVPMSGGGFVYNGQTNGRGFTNFLGSVMTNAINFGDLFASNSVSDMLDAHHTAPTGVAITFSVPYYLPPDVVSRGTVPPATMVMQFGSFGEYGGLARQFAPFCRYAIIGFALFSYFFKFTEELKQMMESALNQRQMQGMSQAVLGTNLSSVTGVYYALFIASFIVTAAVFCFTEGMVAISANFDSIAVFGYQVGLFIQNNSYLQLLCEFVPIWQLLLMHALFLFSRMFVLWPAFLAVRGLIFFLIV